MNKIELIKELRRVSDNMSLKEAKVAVEDVLDTADGIAEAVRENFVSAAFSLLKRRQLRDPDSVGKAINELSDSVRGLRDDIYRGE